ncbi:MAG: glycosyltransferase family 4 protein [Hyphomicrobiales bacterium]
MGDSKTRKQPKKIFYAGGPGNVIRAHKHWRSGDHDPTEVSITFSSQVEQFAADIGAELYIVCHHKQAETLVDGNVIIEDLPKPWPNSSGVFFHIRELVYTIQLLIRAVKFRSDLAIIDSGTTHYFLQSVFALFGIRVVPVLHNALWANGFPPSTTASKVIAFLDRYFWKYVPEVTLCVSPVCERQVRSVAGDTARPLVQIRAQFNTEYFDAIPPPPPHHQRPFTIIFVGRVVESKGVFDIVKIASILEKTVPGEVKWIICGTGADLETLRSTVTSSNLDHVVTVRGWTSPKDLQQVYPESHCLIVPTRSSFAEGLAMTAVEAALAGRPVITNPVVPALEVLRDCSIECKPDDPESYANNILKLIVDPGWYRRMQSAARSSARPFLDRSLGLTEVLKRLL